MLIGQTFFLWWIIGVIICGIAMAWYMRNIMCAVATLTTPLHRSTMLVGFSPHQFIGSGILIILALGAMWFSLLRVSYNTGERAVQQEYTRDVIIALDMSRSMLAGDCSPNRLTGAKQKIMKLLRMLHIERVGLIIFSQRACVQCPLTKDMGAFSLLLGALDEDTLSGGGTTALDEALLTAVKLCERSGERQQKLLLIVTDGEDFSHHLDQAREAARAVGLRIGVLGVGTPEGAPIPLRAADGTLRGHQRDEKGQLVISRLQPQLLDGIAQSCGGTYCTIDMHGDNDVTQLATWIQQHDVVACDMAEQEIRGELFMVGAGCAALLLACAWLL